MDANSKIAKSVANMEVSLQRFKSLQPMGSYERFEFYEYFDLEHPYKAQATIAYLSNQMVHSLLFNFSSLHDDGDLGIFFVSDKDRLKFCNYIDLKVVSEIFSKVASSQASELEIEEMVGGGRMIMARK